MTTALYRRYRPETFDEVIGQDHVTEPLKAALRSNRVTHAYLFSGPRGCGKTTSARILARCLNCAEGPTDTPCGVCESCRELATGGPGSLDVVEIDAASHNGVDDARELRERATFAPVRDRYKVFILDEAHMVTPQGFNALLKLVEEPPEHVKFIFATTEPERVIGTIRSRTHHYPFRLVPADVLTPFLAQLCKQESVEVGEGVLPLVVRAGGGSVRDSLSVLDQLMAGSIDSAIPYDRAVALLGYTDANLLDEAVDALGHRDGAAIFASIERMVESGHDPRRFVEDFLQRLRDLLIITVAGEDARDILGEIPSEQRDRMFEQAKLWGAPALSTAADLTDEALRAMVGATSPRLQLELLVGRILVALSGSSFAGGSGVVAGGSGSVAGGSGPAAGVSGSAAGAMGAGGYTSKNAQLQSAANQVQTGANDAHGTPNVAQMRGQQFGVYDSGAPSMPEADEPQIMGPDGKPLTGAALAREQLRRSRAKQADAAHENANHENAAHAEVTHENAGGMDAVHAKEALGDADSTTGASAPQARPEEKAEPQPQAQSEQRPASAPEQRPAREPEWRPAEESVAPDQSAQNPEPEPEQPSKQAEPAQQESENVTSNLHGKWDEFVEAVRSITPSSAYLIGDHATLVSEDATTVTFGFANQNFVNIFMSRHYGPAAQAIQMVTGVQKEPVAIVGTSPQGNNQPQGGPTSQPQQAQPSQQRQWENKPQQSQASQQRQWENKPQQSQASQQQRQRESKPQQESAWNRNLRPETESGSNANQRTQWESGPDRQARQYSATPSNTTEVAKTPEADRYAPQGNTPQAATTQHDRETREELAQNITEETHESPRGGVKLQTFEGGARRNQSEAGTFESGAQRSQPEMGTSEGDAQTNQPQAETFDDSAQAFEGGARLDDQDAENMNLVGLPLVEKMFGARIIEETNEGNN